MTIEPAVLIGAIATLAGFVGFIFRLFLTGAVLPNNAVRREDFVALQTAHTSLAAGIPALAAAVDKSATDRAAAEARLEKALKALSVARRKNGHAQ